jgi:hypothetical protein
VYYKLIPPTGNCMLFSQLIQNIIRLKRYFNYLKSNNNASESNSIESKVASVTQPNQIIGE